MSECFKVEELLFCLHLCRAISWKFWPRLCVAKFTLFLNCSSRRMAQQFRRLRFHQQVLLLLQTQLYNKIPCFWKEVLLPAQVRLSEVFRVLWYQSVVLWQSTAAEIICWDFMEFLFLVSRVSFCSWKYASNCTQQASVAHGFSPFFSLQCMKSPIPVDLFHQVPWTDFCPCNRRNNISKSVM